VSDERYMITKEQKDGLADFVRTEMGKRNVGWAQSILHDLSTLQLHDESPTLPKIIAALGWQGGTVEQVVAEVARLKTERDTAQKALKRAGLFLRNHGRSIEDDDEDMANSFYLVADEALTVCDRMTTPLGQGVPALLPEHGEVKR